MKPKIRKPFEGTYPVTFCFGDNPDWYVKVVGYPHNGVDFGMPVGIAIMACDDGIISYADNIPDSDGLGINISHSWGLSQYWHLSKLVAKYGNEVKKGDVIGFSGKTGFATGPHLHFGTKVLGQEVSGMRGWINPIDYFEDIIGTPITPPVVNRYHIVLPGNTLWGIAKKYYGKGYLWHRIYEANKEKIKNPNIIYPLQKLLIP